MGSFPQHLKHQFGHGKRGPVSVLATLNLSAFAVHLAVDCLSDLWRQ